MPDIFQLIATWKKQIILVVLLSVVVATAVVFIVPSKFLSTATAIPANPATADRSIVFNSNIKDLYNSLGSPSDLDYIIGTGQEDTVYLSVAVKFDLASFYKLSQTEPFRFLKAARLLKKDTKITKSEYGQLMIRVWCTDKALGAQLANALMDELGGIHQDLMNRNNRVILNSIKETMLSLKSVKDSLPEEEQRERLVKYGQLESEYALILNSKPPALLPVEKARASDKPDRPKKLLIIIASALAAFLFALWLALLLNRRKTAG